MTLILSFLWQCEKFPRSVQHDCRIYHGVYRPLVKRQQITLQQEEETDIQPISFHQHHGQSPHSALDYYYMFSCSLYTQQ